MDPAGGHPDAAMIRPPRPLRAPLRPASDLMNDIESRLANRSLDPERVFETAGITHLRQSRLRRRWLPLAVDRGRASRESHRPPLTVAALLGAEASPRATLTAGLGCRSPSQETVSGVSSSSGRSGCLILR
jgi:hypothetical protein